MVQTAVALVVITLEAILVTIQVVIQVATQVVILVATPEVIQVAIQVIILVAMNNQYLTRIISGLVRPIQKLTLSNPLQAM